MKTYNEFVALNEFKIDLPKLKVSASEAGGIIKEKVHEFLEISKEKVNDPENQKKVKNFLLKLEDLASKTLKAIKSRKGQTRMIIMSQIGMYISLIAGIWGAIFHSGADVWYKPWTFELGGTQALKLALFFFVLQLIIKTFRGISELTSFLSGIKKFFSSLFGLFKGKKSDDEISEGINNLFIEYDLIDL